MSASFIAELKAALSPPLDLPVILAQVPLVERKDHFLVLPEGKRDDADSLDADGFVSAMWNAGVFCTESRQKWLASAASDILALDRGQEDSLRLNGRGHNNILIAPRGSGKSHILKKMVDVARKKTCRTFFCHLNYRVSKMKREPPTRMFADLLTSIDPDLGPYFSAVKTLDEFHAVLSRASCRVVFIVDEIEFVFGLDKNVGDPILSELVHIGEMDGNRTVLAYITGSSSKVRRLCFCKLFESEKNEYPSYVAARDFNETKYISMVLDPI